MRKLIIKILGGYPTYEDAIEAIRKEKHEARYQILTAAVQRLFNTVGEDEILKIGEGGKWFSRGKQISDDGKRMLCSQANHFYNSELWDVLSRELKYLSNKKMFKESGDEMQMAAGKLWLYTIDVINSKLKNMAKSAQIPPK